MRHVIGLANGGGEGFEGGLQVRAGAADVQAHEARAFGAENGAVVERQAGLVHEQVHQAKQPRFAILAAVRILSRCHSGRP